MKRIRISIVLLVALALSPIATLHAQVDFSQVYTFGDSLTDNDAEFLSGFFGFNPKFYGSDPMESVFNKGANDDDNLTNFAVLGSRSSDVLAQAMVYADLRASGSIPAATFFSVQGGANDILDLENNSANLFLLASSPPGDNPQADFVVNDIIINLFLSILQLQQTDSSPTMLWTVPDVTITPYVMLFQLSSDQQTNIRLHIERVNGIVRAIGQDPNFVVFDSYEFLNSMAATPPVVMDTVIEPAPFFGSSTFQFADPIHPTWVANGIVANEMIEVINAALGDNIPSYSEDELARMAGLN